MPYTGNPASVPADAVRFKLGDTTSPYLFSDSEVSYLLSEASANVDAAALAGAEQLAARFASMVDKTVGDLSIKYSQRSKQYLAIAERLRTSLSISGAPPFCGGISRADKKSRYENTDAVPAQFTRDMQVVESEN